MSITCIVSGGQTGADRGGLDAALYCSIPHSGWCPKNRKAEDGKIPIKYNLQEMPTEGYLPRTQRNVIDSDATLIFTYGELEGGSLKTFEFAIKHNKPYLHVDLIKLKRQESVEVIVNWLEVNCPEKCVLNVAGSRASKATGIEKVVMVRMVDVISKVNGKIYYPLQEENLGSVSPQSGFRVC